MLFLAQCLPYPQHGGVAIRTYNILKHLARAFDVTALCFVRHKRGVVREDLAARVGKLAKFGSVEAFPIEQEHSPRRLVWDHARSLATLREYTYYAYSSASYLTRVRELVATRRFDLVHVDSLDLTRYLPLLAGNRAVCGHHNIESDLLRRRAGHERSVARGAYMRVQAMLLRRAERRWCRRVDLNVVVSELDRERLQALVGDVRCLVVPNGVNTEYFTPPEGAPAPRERNKRIVFVGGSVWFPNRDALHFFCLEVLPAIRAKVPDVQVQWVGTVTEEERRALGARHGVEFPGYVEDIRPFVHAAGCYVVPLRVGGGTRLKILDAWAMGAAVVSTTVGCEGLTAEHGRNIVVADSPAGFADAVCGVLADEAVRDRLGREGRRTVEQQYSWEIVGRQMNLAYLELLNPRPEDVGRRSAAGGA
jgi:glycosyltransferase involved in cell wall biosynthesis